MKNKLTEIEKLRLEKKQLIEECYQYEDQLISKWYYTKNNFGHLIANSFLSSVKSSFSELLGGKSPDDKTTSSRSSKIGQILIAATPAIWGFIQPMLIGLAVKKIKSLFLKKVKSK